MLVIGETYNDRKASLLDYIHVCQDLIGTIQKCKISKEPLAREVIALERQSIRDTWAELKALARWQKTSGFEPDEPFTYRKEQKEDEQK